MMDSFFSSFFLKLKRGWDIIYLPIFFSVVLCSKGQEERNSGK